MDRLPFSCVTFVYNNFKTVQDETTFLSLYLNTLPKDQYIQTKCVVS